MKINKIKKELAGNKDYLERNFYIKEIGIFGSFALGVEDNESDVDVLVDFRKGHKDLFNYLRLKYYLEDLLKREVDLVPKKAVKTRLKKKILEQVVYV